MKGVYTYKDKEEDRYLHLYRRLFVKQVPWFALDDLYCRYYTAARGGSAVLGRIQTQTLTRMKRERRERGARWARMKN